MTKEQLQDLLANTPDGEQIAIGTFWTKQDVQDWQQELLTDDEWERFVYWFEKYQDGSWDSDEAFRYAKGAN